MERTVVFIHGMFVTSRCWTEWVPHFRSRGYTAHAPPWPGRNAPVEALRAAHPDPAVGELDLDAIVAHYARFIESLDRAPLLVGHSMGGLVAQLLLQRGLGAGAAAINSAPPRGVLSLRWSFLRSNWPVLNPLRSAGAPYLMSPAHFAYTFAHTMSAEDQAKAYDTLVVPESRRVGRAALSTTAAIDFTAAHAPLLMIAGEKDRIIPASLNRKNARRYRHEGSVVEYREFPGRTHLIIGQHGWQEVADAILEWADRRLGSETAAPASASG